MPKKSVPSKINASPLVTKKTDPTGKLVKQSIMRKTMKTYENASIETTENPY